MTDQEMIDRFWEYSINPILGYRYNYYQTNNARFIRPKVNKDDSTKAK